MRAKFAAALVTLLALSPAAAQAQADADRLRDAVRSLTAQVRSLEDQLAAAQAKATAADRDKQRANQQIDGLKAQVKEAQQANQQAIEEFNQRLAERDQTLDRWKSAYNQAADVARDKDAQRARFESEAATYKARTKSCEVKNAQLMKVSKDILAGYRDLTLGDRFAITEPLIGIGRVSHQNRVQDFRDRILDQDLTIPNATPAEQKGQGQPQNGRANNTSGTQESRKSTAQGGAAATAKPKASPEQPQGSQQ